MRDRRERVEGRVPRRRHAGIGDAWMVKIEREIVGDGAAVNVVQQPLVTRAEQYAVMRNIGIFALHPEMDDEQRGRPAFARQSLRDQLGRASRREGWCQYGYNSVVAGEL